MHGVCLHERFFRVAAPASGRGTNHALTQLQSYAFADSQDLACRGHSWCEGRVAPFLVRPLALQDVSEVEISRLNPDQDIARPGFGRRDVFKPENIPGQTEFV